MQDWKPVRGYEGLYVVSAHGAVKSCERVTADGKHLSTKILNGGCYPNGYEFVCLRKDGHNRNRMTHRLVAEAFIPNPDNLPVVNHKDGNKHNNDVSNLEWCTQGQNLKHAVGIGLLKNQCRIIRKVTITHDSGSRVEFPSMAACCEYFGFTKCWLGNYLRKHGNPCRYGKYSICVSERGGCISHDFL